MQEITPQNVHEILGHHILADGYELVYDAKKSKGSYFHDSRSGKDFLDFFSFFATMPIGHNHPKMNEPEFKAKMAEIALNNPANSDIYTTEFADFVRSFAEIAGTPDFKYYYYVAGGSVGVENAIKAACDWKVRKLGKVGKEDVTDMMVIHFKEAFHGRTGYTMSLTNTADPRKYLYFPKFDWPRITNPKMSFPQNDENLKKVKKLEEKALAEIESAIKKHGPKIAALIIEPIQAEGGENHFRGDFLKELRKLTLDNDILLIFDEVQTGMGITGKMWAHQHFSVVPDLIAFGKKTQVCGFVSTGRIDEVKDNVFKLSSRINSTWGGNLVDMVRCQRYLEIMRDNHLVDNSRHMGEYALGLLQELQTKHPEMVSNARGRGLMMAFDLPSLEKRESLLSALEKNRLLILGCGERSIRFRPHLDINRENLQRGMEIIDETLTQLKS